MKYTAIIAVAVLSFLLALPLTRNSAQNISYAQPLTHSVEAKKVSLTTPTKTVAVTPTTVTPPTPPTCPDTQWIWASDGKCHDKPVVKSTPAPTPSYGSHEELMAAAGIAASDYPAVDYIVSHESGWNANATEPNTGAHGLPQALPYSKTGCGWSDAVCQLQWANSYAVARYGGWWGAYNYWVNHRNW